MDCLFLYNPCGGKGISEKNLSYIRRRLLERYGSVEIVGTKSAEDLEARVRKEKERDVIFAGGDGTFNRVLQAAAGGNLRLGYLPCGTVNDIARSLSIPKNLKGALEVIVKGETAKLDCMRVNGRYAMYIAAAGAFTETTYTTPQSEKRFLGPLAYAIHGLRHGLRFRPFPLKIECDGNTFETESALVLVLNGRSVAGFRVNRSSSMRDGTLELAVVRRIGKQNVFRRFFTLCSIGTLFLRGIRVKKKDILFLRGRALRLETDASVVWDLDGERGPCGSVSVETIPAAVDLFVPKVNNC